MNVSHNGPANSRLLVAAVLAGALLGILIGVKATPPRWAGAQGVVGQLAATTPRRLWLPLLPGPSVRWYKLRLDVTTTSDWSMVRLMDGATTMVAGVVASDGGSLQKDGNQGVTLHQRAGDALSGRQASASMEFGLQALGPTLQWRITRGGWGSMHVILWNVNGPAPVKLADVTWAGSNPPDNAWTLTVAGTDVARGGPLTRDPGEILTAEFELERRLDGALSPANPQFYRAGVDLTTTSDWTYLYLLQGANICDVQIRSTSGNPTQARSSAAAFWLQQAQAGAPIGLTAGLLLNELSAGGDVQFLITKGGAGATTVDFYNANGATPTLVQTVTHAGSGVPGDPRNPLTFTLSSALLASGGPLEAPRPATGKLAWAFYYLWYYTGSWQDPILLDHPLIPYDSSDANALARHIDQAQGAGIDGFIASWWGPGDFTDGNLSRLFNVAALHSFWVMPYLETLGAGGAPRSETEIKTWLEYLLRTYQSRPAWYRLDGKPVIVVWASGALPAGTWQRIFADLHGRGLDAVYIGMGLGDAAALAAFDGLHDYGVFATFRLGQAYQAAGEAIRAYSLLHAGAGARLFAATLQPGYDDRSIPGRAGLYWERRNGDAYRYTFEAAMKSAPDWLFITSWNEWWENTHIEPSDHYGSLYLQLTRELLDDWKNQ